MDIPENVCVEGVSILDRLDYVERQMNSVLRELGTIRKLLGIAAPRRRRFIFRFGE